ncbi:hypothetical protein B1R27_29995 [Streptomyces sp. GKU 895]|nr:hypothetical protein B1R27_29995 [Streptomyces sp. GKU 895]
MGLFRSNSPQEQREEIDRAYDASLDARLQYGPDSIEAKAAEVIADTKYDDFVARGYSGEADPNRY